MPACRQEWVLAVDPYTTLGVKKHATQEEIQKAYRRLAKKLHPDLNPGNKKAEEEFKNVSAAYGLLGDADKRARFDRGEIHASGTERAQQRYYRELDFLDAVNGGKQQLTLPDKSVLDVTIPPGTRDGQVLRLRGKGRPGLGGGPPGDSLIEIAVRPHPVFTRKGDDIQVELPISLREAVLGGKVQVPTPSGPVTMTIPKWANTGRVLRLKGKGVPRPDGSRGDEYVTLKVMLPQKPDPELEKFIAQWRPV